LPDRVTVVDAIPVLIAKRVELEANGMIAAAEENRAKSAFNFWHMDLCSESEVALCFCSLVLKPCEAPDARELAAENVKLLNMRRESSLVLCELLQNGDLQFVRL
jgi:hypothetical protein